MKMNKKADIAITILVIGVLVLCATALFSFYVVDKDRKIKGGIDSVYYLQNVYNLAESVKYSVDNFGEASINFYKNEEVEISGGIIKKEFFNGDLKIEIIDGP